MRLSLYDSFDFRTATHSVASSFSVRWSLFIYCCGRHHHAQRRYAPSGDLRSGEVLAGVALYYFSDFRTVTKGGVFRLSLCLLLYRPVVAVRGYGGGYGCINFRVGCLAQVSLASKLGFILFLT